MKYAPREIFEQILEWAVIPTFDLVLEIEGKGYLMVRRSIEPYKNQWALPGLRMYKDETIDDTLVRVAKQELGIVLDPSSKRLIGQYVGKFKTEHNRQDLSTAYYFRLPSTTEFKINSEHFTAFQFVSSAPSNSGAMYKYYINKVSENSF